MEKVFHKDQIPEIAQEILGKLTTKSLKLKAGFVVALSGDLGAGKTTLTQELARQLGVTETLVSPTFVIMKSYKLTTKNYNLLVHIDAYRLKSSKELLNLGWEELVTDPKNLILIEWPEQVPELIPKNALWVELKHHGEHSRQITLTSKG